MAGEPAFLGTGWSFPPSFSRSGADIQMVSGTEDIHQSLQILLRTATGERVMQPEFGCDMDRFLFEEIDQSLLNTIQETVSDAVLYHEPRINLDEVDISTSESQQGLLLISITYTVRGTNSRFNMVYPFYLNELSTDDG